LHCNNQETVPGNMHGMPSNRIRGKSMGSVVKLIALAAVAVLAAIAANWARDIAYQVNALTVMAAASGYFIYTIRTMDAPRAAVTGYMDDVVRAGVIATVFWGMAGFAAGVYIAFELAFPDLNWGLSFTSFGRLRPLHTSAVIFAFGGNALICKSRLVRVLGL
jgi:cytochrome c oxidase cbb3-type subunit 1